MKYKDFFKAELTEAYPWGGFDATDADFARDKRTPKTASDAPGDVAVNNIRLSKSLEEDKALSMVRAVMEYRAQKKKSLGEIGTAKKIAYVAKAVGSYVGHKKATDKIDKKFGKPTDDGYYDLVRDKYNNDERKAKNRMKGIANATKIDKAHKPGETWKTDSGKTAKKNSDGTISYTENESIAELKQSTQQSYVAKSKADIDKRVNTLVGKKERRATLKRAAQQPLSAKQRDSEVSKIQKRAKGIQTAKTNLKTGKYDDERTVKNPKTGKPVKLSTALKSKQHPAYNAAKATTGRNAARSTAGKKE